MTEAEFVEHIEAAAKKLPEEALTPRLGLSLAMEYGLEQARQNREKTAELVELLKQLNRLKRNQQARDAAINEMARQLVNGLDRLKALEVVDQLERAGMEIVQAPGNLNGVGQSPAPKSPPALRVVKAEDGSNDFPVRPDGGAA